MPKALAIDRDEVKKTFLATGSLKETSYIHGISYQTIKQWAKRYSWPTANRLVTTIKESEKQLSRLREASGQTVTHGTAIDALESHLAESTKTFRSGMATALKRIGETAQDMDGLTALEHSRKLKDSADIAKLILGIGADSGGPSVSINLLNMSADMLAGRVSVSPTL
jgi:hypothetical protein